MEFVRTVKRLRMEGALPLVTLGNRCTPRFFSMQVTMYDPSTYPRLSFFTFSTYMLQSLLVKKYGKSDGQCYFLSHLLHVCHFLPSFLLLFVISPSFHIAVFLHPQHAIDNSSNCSDCR